MEPIYVNYEREVVPADLITPWQTVYFRESQNSRATSAQLPACPAMQLRGDPAIRFEACATFRLRFFAGGRWPTLDRYSQMTSVDGKGTITHACKKVFVQCILAFRQLLLDGINFDPRHLPHATHDFQSTVQVVHALERRPEIQPYNRELASQLAKALSMFRIKQACLDAPNVAMERGVVKDAEMSVLTYLRALQNRINPPSGNGAESDAPVGATHAEVEVPFLLAARLILKGRPQVLPTRNEELQANDNDVILRLMTQVYFATCESPTPS